MTVQSSKLKVQSYSSKFKVIKFFFNFVLLIATLHFALLTLNSSKANAQTSFSLSPPVINLKLKPGQFVSKNIKIANNSLTGQAMSVRLKKLNTAYSDSFLDLPVWIRFSTNQINIPPKKYTIVTVFINVPANQQPGNKKYNIIFQTLAKQTFPYPDSASISGNSSIGSGIGNLLNITILPKEKVLGTSNSPSGNLTSSLWTWVAVLTASLIVLMIKERQSI